ncbi:MAG: peptide ABC transporter substrate-binding protein, partial [Oscillospiraceae bacterium]|nr:peptide ABC transporter substrate-binding protein [Oscillospiraceae bacterium]
MRKILTTLLCGVLLCGVLPLSGCSGQEENTGAGYLFTCTIGGNPDCLDPQFTDNPYAASVLVNIMEGLLRYDETGTLVCAEAESYTVSEDGLHYEFTLCDNCYWYNVDSDPERPERVTARDYVFAFRRLIDPAMRSPYAADFSCLKNAEAIIAGELDVTRLGVSAPDATTVCFELDRADPKFLTLLAENCAVPCNEDFFNASKGRYGLEPSTVLCNGPFYLTKWNYDRYSSGNFLTLRKSQQFRDPDSVYPSNLQFTVMHSRSQADEDFADGNADVLFTQVYPKSYLASNNYTVQPYASQTFGLIFNPDNEQLQNDSLRQALACAINRTAVGELLSDDMQPAWGVIPPSVTLLGRSYRELCADETLITYDPKKAAKLFSTASEELELRTMNTLKILVPNTITDTEALLEICQQWQDLFGYYIGIETVSLDTYTQRIASGEYSIALWAIQPERNSCYAALEAVADNNTLLGLHSGDFSTCMEE